MIEDNGFYDSVLTAVMHGDGALELAAKICKSKPMTTRINAGLRHGKLIVQLELPQEAVLDIVRGD